MADNRLPNPNRYITDNDADGNSFFSAEVPESMEVGYSLGGGLQRLGYHTQRPPVSLSANEDLEHYKHMLQPQTPVPLIAQDGGANIWYNDIAPDTGSPMHRNVSIDIIIVLVGEVELTLSNGETRIVKPGDIVVQRSTLHKWRNPSKTEWARMVAIVSACQPCITEKGQELGPYIAST